MRSLIVFIMLFPAICFAGNDSLSRSHNFLVKWNPFSWIDYSSIQLGAEYFYKPNWSVNTEFGLIVPMSIFGKYDLYLKDNSGYRMKLQPRYYMGKYFIGPELHVLDVKYKSMEPFATQFITDSTGQRTAIDDTGYNIRVRKNVVCLNIVGGVQFLKSKRIGAEFFGGLGVRYVNAVFNGVPQGKEHTPMYSDVGFSYFKTKEEGERYLFNVTLGLRVIVRLHP